MPLSSTERIILSLSFTAKKCKLGLSVRYFIALLIAFEFFPQRSYQCPPFAISIQFLPIAYHQIAVSFPQRAVATTETNRFFSFSTTSNLSTYVSNSTTLANPYLPEAFLKYPRFIMLSGRYGPTGTSRISFFWAWTMRIVDTVPPFSRPS